MDGNLGARPPPDRASSGQLDGIGGGVAGDSGFVASGPMGGAGGYGDTSSTMVESASVAWTDEKHSSFLNSIEASFVNQMYSQELFRGLTSRTQKDVDDDPCSAQYEVLKGCLWGLGQKPTQAGIQNEAHIPSRNPWIRWKGTSSNQFHNSCMNSSHLDSVGFSTEVTDQNFVDDPTRSKQASRVCMKKRSRRTASATGNQAAPAAGEDAKSGSAKTAKHGVEERP